MHLREMLERDTAALALPEGRKVGDPGHEVALRYLEQRLKEIGLSPFKGESFRLGFERAGHHFTNLVGVVRGRDSALPPLLVGAHYDSCVRGPSADDNATAVAVALATASRFQKGGLQRDLYIALFDSEEPPFFLSESMGSKRFYEDHCQGIDFGLCVIMDLIGHDVEFPAALAGISQLFPAGSELLAVTGCESHPSLPSILSRAFEGESALKVLALPNSVVGDMSDHHAFRLGGEPYLFLSCGEGKYYHDLRDDLNWINFDKVAKVERLVAAVLQSADGLLPETAESELESDSGLSGDHALEFEISQLRVVFGQHLPKMQYLLGLGASLTTRSEVNTFHRALARLVRRG
jgi:hypothetical protein